MKQSDIDGLVKETRQAVLQEVMFHLKGQADHERRLYGGPSSGLMDAMLIVNQLLQEATHG